MSHLLVYLRGRVYRRTSQSQDSGCVHLLDAPGKQSSSIIGECLCLFGQQSLQLRPGGFPVNRFFIVSLFSSAFRVIGRVCLQRDFHME
jgi:hypothetical protein